MNIINTSLDFANLRKRNPWPFAIVLFFVVFISSMAAWITVAVRNDMDLVRKDYYEQEILFQKQIDRVQRTARLGGMKLHYDTAASTLQVQLPPDHVLAGASGTVHLYRPSDAKLDRHFALAPNAAGAQALELRALASGLWKAQVNWKAAGAEYFYEEQLVIARN